MKTENANDERSVPADTSFEDLTRRLLSVPKAEVERLEKKDPIRRNGAKAS